MFAQFGDVPGWCAPKEAAILPAELRSAQVPHVSTRSPGVHHRRQHQPPGFLKTQHLLVCRPSTLIQECRFVTHRSQAGPLLQLFGIPRPLDRDFCGRAFDVTQVLGGQFDRCCANILFKAIRLRGPRDRHDPRLPRKEPRKSCLSGGGSLAVRYPPKQVNQSRVCLPGLRGSPTRTGDPKLRKSQSVLLFSGHPEGDPLAAPL
jgi:hypothetical protein